MTDKDRYIIYKMWVFIMRGVFLILTRMEGTFNPASHMANKEMFTGDYNAFCNALGNPRSWNWLRYGSTSTSTSSDTCHSASSEPAP